MFQELASVNLVLQAQKSNTLPAWLGRAAQAFFLDSLQRIKPELSAAAHNGSTMKPFTSSTLTGTKLDDEITHVQKGQTVELRFTTLHPHLSAVLLNGLIPSWCANGVTLHDQTFKVNSVHLQPNDGPWSGITSFATLFESASPRHRIIRLEFMSPTAFKATDGPFVPLPQPQLVFSSLLDRWNRFSPVQLPEALYGIFANGIAIEHLDITTYEVRFGNGKWDSITGFVGSVTYRIEPQSDEIRRGINALAAFAKYSGVGVKSTTGMGQVRMQ